MSSTSELEFTAGDPALDFLNTIDERLGPHPREYLRAPQDLAVWGQRAGLLGTGPVVGCTAAELNAARDLRAHLCALLDALTAGREAPHGDLRALAGAVASAHASATLEQTADGILGWRWDSHRLSTVRHVVASTAGQLLSSPAASRIGLCAGPTCGWFFLDHTKRGNRRWCSMSDCGQEAKTERRRARVASRAGVGEAGG